MNLRTDGRWGGCAGNRNKRKLHRNAMLGMAFFACILGALLTAVSVKASMKNTDAFSIEVEYGYGSVVQQKCNMPIRLRFTDITRDFDGTVRFAVPADQNDYVLFTEELHLVKGSEETLHYSVPIIPNASQIRIDILEQDALLFAHTITLRAEEVGQYVTVASMNRENKPMEYLNGEEFSALYGWSVRTFALDPGQFPRQYQELDMVDILVASEEEIAALSQQQKAALRMWLKRGGCLLCNDSQQALETDGEVQTGYMTVFPEEKPCLFWKTAYGDGYAAGIAADLFETERIDSRVSENILRVLINAVGVDDWLHPDVYSMEGFEQDSWCAEALFHLNGYGSNRPVIAMYLAVILVYICIVLPLLFWILKKLDRQHYLREVLCAAALFFSGIIFFAGARTRFIVPTLGYVRVLDYETEQISDEIYLSVQLPYQQEISVQFSPDYQASPLCFGQEHDAKPELLEQAAWYRYQLDRSSAVSELSMRNSYAVTPLYFRLSEVDGNEKRRGVYGKLSFENGQVSGTLDNQTGAALLFGVLVKDGQLAVINRMETGETEVSAAMHSFDLDDREALEALLQEEIASYFGQQGGVYGTDTEKSLRNSAISAIMDYALLREKNSERIWMIGVNAPTEAEFIRNGAGWEISGIQIILSQVKERGGSREDGE